MSQEPDRPILSKVAFFAETRDFVKREFATQRRTFEEEWSRSERERVAKGRCITGIDRVEKREDWCFFFCPENLSDFREGDVVRLHRGNPRDPVARGQWGVDGMTAEGTEYFALKLIGSALLDNPPEEGWTLDGDFIDLEDSVNRAIDEMAETERGRERIIPLFQDAAPDEVDPAVYEAGLQQAELDGFNEQQQEAIAEGVSAQWCSLIQGPPGTGKTRTLANIVKQRVERGERILVTAVTHRAIEQALLAIAKMMPGFTRIGKIGLPLTQGRDQVPAYESFADCPWNGEEGGYVIGATPFAARSRRLAGVDFDVVVMDEASQMTVPLGIMAMLSAEIYLIIGDAAQLPPVVQSDGPENAAEYSIFRRLEKSRERVMLTTTYRMNGEITNWVGGLFYQGRLQSAPQVAGNRFRGTGGIRKEERWIEQIVQREDSLQWVETGDHGTRHYSMEEAGMVARLARAFRQAGCSPAQMGVVTPFRRQARMVRYRLRGKDGEESDLWRDLVVDTVERMQGQERDIILISTAASDVGFLHAVSAFLYQPARLNVAVSRARLKVVVFAANSFLSPEGDEPMKENVYRWKNLRENCSLVTL